MKYPDLMAVTLDNKPVRPMQMYDAYRAGYALRAVHVYVIQPTQGVWIQKRAQHISEPGQLSESAAGLVDIGESFLEAAIRELREEIDLDGAGMRRVGQFRYSLPSGKDFEIRNVVEVFVLTSDAQPVINPDEVAGISLRSVDQVSEEVESHPERYTVWTRHIFPQVATQLNAICNAPDQPIK